MAIEYTHEARLLGPYPSPVGQTCADGTFLFQAFVSGTIDSYSVDDGDTTILHVVTSTEELFQPVGTAIFGDGYAGRPDVCQSTLYVGDRSYFFAFDFGPGTPLALAIVRVEEDASLTLVTYRTLADGRADGIPFWYDRERSVLHGQVLIGLTTAIGRRYLSFPLTSTSIEPPVVLRSDRFFYIAMGLRGPEGEQVYSSPSQGSYDLIASADGATYVSAMVAGDAASPYPSGLWGINGLNPDGSGMDLTTVWHSPVGKVVSDGQARGDLDGSYPILLELDTPAVTANYIPQLPAPAEWSNVNPYEYAGYTVDGFVRTRAGTFTVTIVYTSLEEAYYGSYSSVAPTYEEFLDVLAMYGYTLADIATVNTSRIAIAIESPVETIYALAPPDTYVDWRHFLGKSRSGNYLVQDQNLNLFVLEPTAAVVEPEIYSALRATRRRFS